MPLHVSSTTCSSSGGQNCIVQHLVSSHSVGGCLVHRLRGSSTCAPDLWKPAKRTPPKTSRTKSSNTQRTENKTTDVVIQQHSRKLLVMDILMSETRWAHKKWNKTASDVKLVFHSSAITMMHGPINIMYNSCLLLCYSYNFMSSAQSYSKINKQNWQISK